jgi:hypothetical protein
VRLLVWLHGGWGGKSCGWRTGVSIPVVFLLDLGALLLGVEILIGDLFELDHFGGCVWVIGVLREWGAVDV